MRSVAFASTRSTAPEPCGVLCAELIATVSPLSNGIPTRSDMASYQAAHECKTTASHTRNKGWIRIAIEDAELVRALIGCASSHSARMQPRFRDPRRRDPGGKFGHLRKTSRARTGESDASEHERIDADQPAAASLTS